MSDLVFLDTETLGLDPCAPIWEFAAIRRVGGSTISVNIHIDHDPGPWLADYPERFREDYERRYRRDTALMEAKAAAIIDGITRDAHIVGAVPNFDTERLAKLLRRNGFEPGWHYHLIDIENIVVGWLHGVAQQAITSAQEWGETPPAGLVGRKIELPWKSDDLSRAVGVDPDDYARHTAMGDVKWAMAQWDAVTK